MIPRSTSVLARRLPPSKAGRGNAQNYMAAVEGSNTGFGRNDSRGGYGANGAGGGAGWKAGSMSKRFDGKDDYRNGGGAGGRDDMQNAPQVRSLCGPLFRSGIVVSYTGLVFSTFPFFSQICRNLHRLSCLLLRMEMKLVP